MKKEYTIGDFTFRGNSNIEEHGRFSFYSGEYEVNTSSILTRLIQEAGRFCERYASDLFIDWKSVEKYLGKKLDPSVAEERMTFLFGFREDGVDHDTFVLSRYNSGSYDCPRAEYRSIWRLDILKTDDEVFMTLGRVSIPY